METKAGLTQPFYGRPFVGAVSTSTSLTNAALNAWTPTDSSAALAAVAECEYALTQLLIAADVPVTVTLTDGTTAVSPAFQFPAGAASLPFDGPGLRFGRSKTPHVSVAATGGGNAAAQIMMRGVVIPAQA